MIKELIEQQQLSCAICQCSRIMVAGNENIEECLFPQLDDYELIQEQDQLTSSQDIVLNNSENILITTTFSTSAWCIFLAEMIGSLIFQLLAEGANATCSLEKSKGQHAGWLACNLCWGLGVMMGIYTVGWASGGHLNPAVTMGLCLLGRHEWRLLPFYWMGQYLGWFLGGIIICLIFYPHFQDTEIFEIKRGIFFTSGAYERKHVTNFFTEFVCTFILVFCILGIINPNNQIPSGVSGILVGLLVACIIIALGGSTGASMNPARDLGPRLAFWIIYGRKEQKGDMQWWYALFNFVAPLLGGMAAAGIYQATINYFN